MFQTGLITSTKDCRRYIHVHALCKSLSSVVCEILQAASALTGCDTTSSFFGIRKKSMLKALKETPNQFSDLSRIECSDIDDSVDLSRKLVSRLYDPKGKSKRCHIDLNKLRVKLATVKDSTLVRLPPSEDMFDNVIAEKSNKQLLIFTSCLFLFNLRIRITPLVSSNSSYIYFFVHYSFESCM
jgi:hypothetical protein